MLKEVNQIFHRKGVRNVDIRRHQNLQISFEACDDNPIERYNYKQD